VERPPITAKEHREHKEPESLECVARYLLSRSVRSFAVKG
jgi:hypothetical protein